jgi:hypothetical protein
MPEKNTWTIEELVALTDKVQNGTVEFRGKPFEFQFCELSEKEEPKLKALPDNATETEKNDWYAQIGNDRILAMITKANAKSPDTASLTPENWAELPITLRFSITSEILSLREDVAGNFSSG